MKNDANLQRVRFLESNRVFLTPRTMADFDDHYRWDHDREIVYLDDMYYRPREYDKAREQFEKRLKADDTMCFSIILKENGAHIGLAELYDISDYERRCLWGIILTKAYWRQGYGTEAAGLVLAYVFKELGFRRLKSYTHSGNVASMKFQEKLGFVREGVLRQEYFYGGAYVDGIDYAMLVEEYNERYHESHDNGNKIGGRSA